MSRTRVSVKDIIGTCFILHLCTLPCILFNIPQYGVNYTFPDHAPYVCVHCLTFLYPFSVDTNGDKCDTSGNVIIIAAVRGICCVELRLLVQRVIPVMSIEAICNTCIKERITERWAKVFTFH